MDEQALKAAVSQFLKKVGFTAQREIEKAIRDAMAEGNLKEGESFTAGMNLSSERLGMNVTIYGKIEL